MKASRTLLPQDVAALTIRAAIGLIFIAHGSQKLFGVFGGRGINGTIEAMTSLGIHPGLLWGWVVALTEFLGGVALLLGLYTRLAGLLIFITMVVAIAKVHWAGGFFAPKGIEYNLALISMAVSLVITGGGSMSLDNILLRAPEPTVFRLAERHFRQEDQAPHKVRHPPSGE